MKKLIITAGMLLLTQLSYADNCPTVEALKKHDISGWQIVDSSDGKPLPAKREQQFTQEIVQFTLAEWKKNSKNKASVHCYYRDQHGADMEAYVTKENLSPNNASHHWYKVSGYMHCAAGMSECSFGNSPMMEQQLAKK